MPNHYSSRVWRLEHYRIQPTFPQEDGKPAHMPSDELLLKEFEGFENGQDARQYENKQEAREAILRELHQWAESICQTQD